MKYSDRRQREQAKSKFNDAMYDYAKVLSMLEEDGIYLTTDNYNQITRQVNKLTKTLLKIKEESGWQRK